jgi:ubiquinone/menaquinone biosynthesis C-methylase UbiE
MWKRPIWYVSNGHSLYNGVESTKKLPMTLRYRTSACELAIAAMLLIGATCAAADDVGGKLVVFNDNGAWSWFEDERAIVDRAAGRIIVSSVANQSGTGGEERTGDIEVAALGLATGAVERFTLSDALEADDHDSAALWRRPDGRYLAVYSKHSKDRLTRYRISKEVGSISRWDAEQTFENRGGTTYSNLLHLSNSGGRPLLFNFTRTRLLDPHVLVSLDDGATWSRGGRLLKWPKPEGAAKFSGTDGGRPYLKYASNGTDEIHFIASEDHPRAYDNSLYHGVIRDGKVYDSFGREVDGSVFDDHASRPDEYTPVFDTGGSPLAHAWATDLHLDRDGRPRAVFTARTGDSEVEDHRFLYARFDGRAWHVQELAKAGPALYQRENDYTGLAAIDPANVNRVFISTNIDPRNQTMLPHHEIFAGTTAADGAAWTWLPVTFNSSVDNLRPIVPVWDDSHTALLWLRGTYSTFTDYDLDVVGVTDLRPLGGEATADAKDAVPPALQKYKGRQIAQTMHYLGAPWLTREEREQEEDCETMVKALNVQPGQTVCDMGCGNGFYTLKLAKLVGEQGRVYAVDIQREMLGLLEESAKDENFDNVETVLGTVVDPKLPEASMDLVLLVDVYHEFSHPEQMLAAIRKSLKPNGRVALVEFRGEDPLVPIKPLHKMSKEQIMKEFPPNGFKLVAEFDELPWQHLMFFQRENSAQRSETDGKVPAQSP